MDHDRNTCQTDFDETSEDSHENDTIEPDEIKLHNMDCISTDFSKLAEQLDQEIESIFFGAQTESSIPISEESSTLINNIYKGTSATFNMEIDPDRLNTDLLNEIENMFGDLSDDDEEGFCTALRTHAFNIQDLDTEKDDVQNTYNVLQRMSCGMKKFGNKDKENDGNANANVTNASTSSLLPSDFSFMELNNRGATSSPFSSEKTTRGEENSENTLSFDSELNFKL